MATLQDNLTTLCDQVNNQGGFRKGTTMNLYSSVRTPGEYSAGVGEYKDWQIRFSKVNGEYEWRIDRRLGECVIKTTKFEDFCAKLREL